MTKRYNMVENLLGNLMWPGVEIGSSNGISTHFVMFNHSANANFFLNFLNMFTDGNYTWP